MSKPTSDTDLSGTGISAETGATPFKERRIIIVGGGCSGISAAKLLAERRVYRVTVLEAADRLGGKAETYWHDGTAHDLATCYLAWGYGTAFRWLREKGMRVGRIQPPVVLLKGDDRRIVSLSDYASGVGIASKMRALPQAVRYIFLWFRFAIAEANNSTSARAAVDLAMPFSDWCRLKRLPVIERVGARALVTAGYGYLEALPTLHCLRWLKPSILFAGLATQVYEVVGGIGNLWNALALDLDVRLNHEVARIETMPDGPVVTTRCGKTFACDDVIIAVPLSQSAKLLGPDVGLAQFAASMRSHKYASLLFRTDRPIFASHHESVGLEKHLGSETVGKTLAIRRTAAKTPHAACNESDNDRIYVSYHLQGTHSLDDLESYLREDIKWLGGHVEAVLLRRSFDYMQTYDQPAIRANIATRIQDIQGRQGIWLSTASSSFEATENIIDRNEEIVAEMAVRYGRFRTLAAIRLRLLRLSRLMKMVSFLPRLVLAGTNRSREPAGSRENSVARNQ